MNLRRALRNLVYRPRRASPPRIVRTGNELPADVSFMVADVKYEPGRLIFLEFGQGQMSGFNGYWAIYGEQHPWLAFGRHLAKVGRPVGMFLSEVLTPKAEHIIQGARDGGVLDLGLIQGADEFDQFVQRHRKGRGDVRRNSIASHHGLLMRISRQRDIVARVRDDYPEQARERIQRFKQRIREGEDSTDFLLLNRATAPYASRKDDLAALFERNGLGAHVPRSATFPTEYSSELASEILRQFDHDKLVIKPLNSSGGKGVILLPRDEFDATLARILNPTPALEHEDSSFSYWLNDANDRFIVQSYEKSKPVEVGRHTYDATMRLIFALRHDQGELEVEFIDCFWNLPKEPLQSDVSFADQSKSYQARARLKSGETMSSAVDDDDAKEIREIVLDIMPRLYENMLATHHSPSVGPP